MGFKRGDLVRFHASTDLIGIITKINPRQVSTGSQLTYCVWWTRPVPFFRIGNAPYREHELVLVSRQESE